MGSDRLASLLEHFSVSAKTFHSGLICGASTLEADGSFGQLHLVRAGRLEVRHGARIAARIDEPSLMLYSRPMTRRFVSDKTVGAQLVCANIEFEGGPSNPIATALPPFVCLPLTRLTTCEPVLKVLFDEAESRNCGRQVVLDRLFEVVLVNVLRELMELGQVRSGMLAGMSHERLRHALVAVHERPGLDWTLEQLADIAGMSRTAFATSFRVTVGTTPGQYLQHWRIGMAQKLMLRGMPLKLIAADVGYGSEAALSRAFRAQTGMSPREWKKSSKLQASS